MRVVLDQLAAEVLQDLPDDVYLEVVVLMDAVAAAPCCTVPTAAFTDSCWVVYIARGNVVEVFDVGWAG
ncbi:hypothetical protein H1V43_36630 [Streptomyces sp. PSKA54]|uniref:Uncharacterized protein n=1 Tax=Streptomyces himalayensis subsp. aureolus TaxID=2758039 RepID=A0A7W2HK23_9ACTN|nr:hypothetical protein [Streptomyces himalayensis]MBA4866730.1 hypothetical protein [Streptomyces himalayensis subsp. aureolus]